MAEASSSSSNDIVHSTLNAPDRSRHAGDNTPTTPTPNVRFSQHPPAEIDNPIDDSAPETPTRHSFGGVRGQRPLPEDPPSSHGTERTKREELSLKRGSSNRSTASGCSDDVEMGEGDAEEGAEDDGSDNDSVTSDSQRPSKKKKGQRFFCTEFPPCQLSFTRSEHLARHIRKHTGERPFQCHCSRRFSRLDNLRQHAQTVHVNEDIPGDSLAATSTRFQRQIRTDRVRPPGNGRPRSSTMTSQGASHGKGHSRNLSASSVGSTASSMGVPEDLRRRPPPLAMANDPNKRGMMSVDTYNPVTGSPSQQYAYFPQSPSGFSTPTSTTFSTGPASPGFTSPPSSISRSSFYNGARHGRRLSVPSGAHPYQNTSYPPPYYSPMPSAANPAYSQQSSVYASPTSSVFSHGRRDSETELEFRRRTWHSGTYPGYTQRPATSGLMYGQTPDEPRPAMSQQSAASQVTRLPGIESFDHAPPSTARAPASSPMMVESEPRPHSSGRPSDAGLHQNLTRLDITSANAPPPDGHWQASHAAPPHHGYFMQQQQPGGMPSQIVQAPPPLHHEQPTTPRRNKRQAWYGGPVGPVTFGRPSPEDSGSSDGVPTPLTQQGGEYHPVIISQNEPYPAHTSAAVPVGGPDNQHKVQYTSNTSYPRLSAQQQPHQDKPEPIRADSGFQSFAPVPGHVQAAQQHTYALQAGHDPRFASGYMQAPNHPEQRNDMGRLEALVAVATSENRVVENRN